MAERAGGLLYLPIIKAGLLPIIYLWAGKAGLLLWSFSVLHH